MSEHFDEVFNSAVGIIKEFEGFSSKRYICPTGHPTIGYGHVIKANERFGANITEEEALALLKRDMLIFYNAVKRGTSGLSLTVNQFAALLSLVFNIGEGAFLQSTVRKRLYEKDFVGAAEAFKMWKYGTDPKTKKKFVLQGLVRRREAEAALFLS